MLISLKFNYIPYKIGKHDFSYLFTLKIVNLKSDYSDLCFHAKLIIYVIVNFSQLLIYILFLII